MKAGLYFSTAFTMQRMLVAELAYLALAPFLLSPVVNGIVYMVVGAAMSAAGAIVLRQNRYPHLHLLGHHHDEVKEMETTSQVFAGHHSGAVSGAGNPPVRWTVIHGFIAGFSFGGFSVFVNTVAAPAMPSAWFGFLPGMLFGVGTMIMLVVVGGVFGASLRWSRMLSEHEIARIGAQTGGRTLFFGGLLFAAAGISALVGVQRYIPIDMGSLLIGLFAVTIAIPAFVYSLKEVLATRRASS
jgi:hypothetical protein